jgi:four helix bundle protein
MGVNSYRELKVWQLGMEIAKDVYLLSKQYPKDEIYGLTSQTRRAAVSIPANIAEGHERDSTKEFLHHVFYAQGSLAELETHLLLSIERGYSTSSTIEISLNKCFNESKMLTSLRRALKAKLNPPNPDL